MGGSGDFVTSKDNHHGRGVGRSIPWWPAGALDMLFRRATIFRPDRSLGARKDAAGKDLLRTRIPTRVPTGAICPAAGYSVAFSCRAPNDSESRCPRFEASRDLVIDERNRREFAFHLSCASPRLGWSESEHRAEMCSTA